VWSFRIGDRGSDREDDLLDAFYYGIALALRNSEASNSSLLQVSLAEWRA
jgi:hypothetical protein